MSLVSLLRDPGGLISKQYNVRCTGEMGREVGGRAVKKGKMRPGTGETHSLFTGESVWKWKSWKFIPLKLAMLASPLECSSWDMSGRMLLGSDHTGQCLHLSGTQLPYLQMGDNTMPAL